MTSEDKAWQQKLFEIWKRTIKESEKKFVSQLPSVELLLIIVLSIATNKGDYHDS